MTTVAPGWYADADDPSLIRWWDGEAWTEHTQPNPAAAPLPVVQPPVVPPPIPATSAPKPADGASQPAASAPVPPPFAATTSPDLLVPPTADAAPSRREARHSGSPAPSPSIPVAEPVRLVPPSSTSIPISEPVRLVPPTSPAVEPAVETAVESAVESAGVAWTTNDPPAGDATITAPPPVFGSGGESGSGTGMSASDGAASGAFAVTPLATVPPAPASASTPWTSSAAFAAPTGSVDLSSADYEPMVRSWGAPRSGSGTRAVTGVSTAGAWMLALSPLLQLGLVALGWALTEGGTSTLTPVILGALGLVLLAWIIIAAIADFRRLGSLGHDYRPSVLWILVGPLMYLIARAIHVMRTAGRGAAPAWVYVGLSIVAGAAIGAASIALPREASLTELRQVEASIVAELQSQGLDYEVICPDEATLAAGTSFVCTAYDELGPTALLRVTYGGVPGSFDFSIVTSGATSN